MLKVTVRLGLGIDLMVFTTLMMEFPQKLQGPPFLPLWKNRYVNMKLKVFTQLFGTLEQYLVTFLT